MKGFIIKVIFFSNGNTAFFDENGQQVPELQKSWLKTYLKFLEENGIDPTGIEFTMPNGSQAKPFKVEGGFNWRISA